MTSPDALRAAFEQWVTAKPYEMPVDRLDAYGAEYRLDEVELAWEAWQAALAHAAPTPEPVDRAAITAAVERMRVGWSGVYVDGYNHAIYDVLRLLTGGTDSAVCEWHQVEEDYDSYTACHNRCFEFNDGTPADNHFTYCPYCAKPIRTVLTGGTDERSGT